LNIIFGIVCLFVCVCAFSLRRESPDMILGDKPFIFEVVLSQYPTKILDQQDWVTCNKTTRFYKVQWNDHSEDEAMWEHEEFLRSNYPDLLPSR
jgi:hypothetical protein